VKLGNHEVTFRGATHEDRAWVCCTWRDSIHERHPTYTRRQAHALVNTLFMLAQVEVMVAEIPGDPAVLVGFVAVLDDELMWLYVSNDFRGLNIAKRLKEMATE
jgi:ribosomal protein S18 acetylase RimI-like enzyme